MEKVIDCSAPSSPEELALHFLMRHAACRMALTSQAGGEAPLHSCPSQPRQVATPAHEPAPADDVPTAEVTNYDSCAARFSRAYAAARHRSPPAGKTWGTRSAA
mgnify:CR=1 FL=1